MDAQKSAANARLSLEMMLDALRATAQEGLSYTGNEYDRAPHKKLLDMASEEYAAITGLDAETIRDFLSATSLRNMAQSRPRLA